MTESEVYRRIHCIPLQKRWNKVGELLGSIDIDSIRVVYSNWMEGEIVFNGLPLKWRARRVWDRQLDYLANGGLNRNLNPWHLDLPDHPDLPGRQIEKMSRRYRRFFKKYKSSPFHRGAISTAVRMACSVKEERLKRI